MGSSLFLNGNVDFAPLGKKNPRDGVRTTPTKDDSCIISR